MSMRRKDRFIAEAIEELNLRFELARGDQQEAFNSLTKIERDFIDGEIAHCADDCRYYLENYHAIRGEAEDTLITVYPFLESQEIFFAAVEQHWVEGRPVFVIVLKARQLGLSTISQGCLFWKTIFTPLCNSMVVAQDPSQAGYLFDMSRLAYDNLPWWMRPERRYEAKGKFLVFDREDAMQRRLKPGLQSNIFVEAANKMTGVARGKSLRCLHASEMGFWVDPETLSTQLNPTMNAHDGLYIMESTANGRDNLFHRLWKQAMEGETKWKPVFIEFFRVKKYSIPIPANETFKLTTEERAIRKKVQREKAVTISDEQFHWRRKTLAEVTALEGAEWKFFQEYPQSSWQEAFQGSGLCAFDKRKLQTIMETTCTEPGWFGEIELDPEKLAKRVQVPKLSGQRRREGEAAPAAKTYGSRLRLWRGPQEGAAYYIGVDVAHGIQGGDFSCANVIRIGRGAEPDEQVAEWHGWIDPTPFAGIVVALALYYNQAELAIECNDIGLGMNSDVWRNYEYDRLFRWKKYDKITNFTTDFFGWQTNSKTRPMLIYKFREGINDGSLVVRSTELIDECMDFSQGDNTNRFEGQNGNDDRVFAAMIARFCAHDSDWAMEQAAMPNKEAIGKRVLVVNKLKQVMQVCESLQEAEDWIERSGILGLEMREISGFKDFNNTDFSPVHDKPGIQHDLHYKYGVPEGAVRELAMYADMGNASDMDSDDSWKSL
jgi:hypothetical protein